MLLTLSVISHHSAGLGPNAFKVFDDRGGTIGRADNNFWVLPDPEKSVSRTHAAVRVISGSFYLEDLSVNGIFLRSTGEQIGRGEPYALRDGDRIAVGDYELLAQVLPGGPAQTAAAPGPAPAEAWPSAPPAATPWPSAPQQAYGAAPTMAGGYQPAGMAQPASGGAGDLDPMRALGPPTGRTGPRPGSGESYHDLRDRSQLEGHYQPPDVRFPAGAPPTAAPMGGAGQESELTAFGHKPGAPAQPAAPAWQQPPQPRQEAWSPAPPPPPPSWPPAQPGAAPPQQEEHALTMFGQRSGPLAAPPPQYGAPPAASGWPPATSSNWNAPPPQQVPAEDPMRQYRPQPEAGYGQGQVPAGYAAPGYPAPPAQPPARGGQPPPPAAAPSGAPSLAEMFASAGLDPSRVPPEVYAQLGFILRTVVQGTVGVLQARSQVKGTFRLPMTMIQPVENNPLKFSANFEDAMQNLFLKRTQGWLGPAESFQDAFDDLIAHEMAMLAGIRAAFTSMLQKFSPDALEAQYERKSKRGGLFGGGKAAYWDLYRESFEELASDAEGNFQRLFGEDFAKAYHDQLQRLLTAQRHQRRRH